MKSFSDYIIDKNAIKHNLVEYKKLENKSKICAVVKADAYGMGIENIVDAVDGGVDYYAVACFKEAMHLRTKTKKPILILNFVKTDTLNCCTENSIRVSVSNFNEAKQIKKYCNQNIKIHLAINTGMNRIGFSCLTEFEKTLKYLKLQKSIIIEGIFTHLYNANNVVDTKKQFCIFMQYVNMLSKYFDVSNIIKHVASSLPAIKYPGLRLNMVRLGILLYGKCINKNIDIKPVLQIKSKITSICKIKKGESVGYGKNFVAEKPMKVATIPLGYADGIFRRYSKKGKVFVNGKECKILGNICMDMFMIDVSNTKTKVGDNVEILGEHITLEEFAKNAGTIEYEVLTNIKKRRFNVKSA